MRFWDSSAVVGLCLQEPHTPALQVLSGMDPALAVWWATLTECLSGLERGLRMGKLDGEALSQGRVLLKAMAEDWFQVSPHEGIRRQAEQLIQRYPLSAADAFQLAAALKWCGRDPQGAGFVCLDRRLREAATKEGFQILPA